jgi:hypothetical protein
MLCINKARHMFDDNMALANAAQSEALELGAYNKELLFPYQRDIILKNEEM